MNTDPWNSKSHVLETLQTAFNLWEESPVNHMTCEMPALPGLEFLVSIILSDLPMLVWL